MSIERVEVKNKGTFQVFFDMAIGGEAAGRSACPSKL